MRFRNGDLTTQCDGTRPEPGLFHCIAGSRKVTHHVEFTAGVRVEAALASHAPGSRAPTPPKKFWEAFQSG